MLQQKNDSQEKPKIYRHIRTRHSADFECSYGPPPIAQAAIDPKMVVKRSKTPLGLTNYRNAISTKTREQKGESYFDLAVLVGELKLFKRLKNVRYLKSFSSKKNMYNVCEESLVGHLHERLAGLRKQQQLHKSKIRKPFKFA